MTTNGASTTMEVLEIAPGLWRWTAPHPEWTPEKGKPGGWGQMVGCIFYDPAGSAYDPAGSAYDPAGSASDRAGSASAGAREAIILIDPLAPPEGTRDAARFWDALDRDVERAGAPVAILVGNEYHARSAQAVHDRYQGRHGASIWAHARAASSLSCAVTGRFQDGQILPSGVTVHSITSLSEGEVAFHIPGARALAITDALTGIGAGAARVVPASWAPDTPAGQSRYRDQFRPSLQRLLDLDFDRLLTSHGAPVLEHGRQALEDALAAPAWGEP